MTHKVIKGALLGLAGLAALGAPTAAHAGLEPVNLAMTGAAYQSSQPSYYANPYMAIDGVDGGDPNNYGATLTDADWHSWWEVDLGDERHIGTIEIINRTDCCIEQTVPFVVLVADFPLMTTDITDADGFTYPGVTRYIVADAVRSKFIVPVHRKGRYVRIGLLREFTPLALGEVKVFEEPSAGTLRKTSSSAQSGTSVSKSAVDNSIDGNYVNGGVSVSPTTTGNKFPFWDLQMDNDFPIESVDVYSTNTTCCSYASPQPKFSLYTSPLATAFGTTPPTGALPAGQTRLSGLVQGAPSTVNLNRTVGRLRVQLEGVDSLSLAEVKVWALATGSQGGYATISSKSSSSVEPFAGIDLNTANAGDDITRKDVQTNLQTDPYYDIDLGGDRYIETIRVWGQTDLSSTNLFSVWTSEFTKFPTSSPAYTAAKMRENQLTTGAIEWKTVGFDPVTTVAINHRARFIRVQVEGANQRLGLRELEIVTTEGYIETQQNGGVWSPNVVPGTSGYHTRPNEPIDFYVFSPNFTTGSGFLNNWMYANTAVSSSTPTTTPFSVAPVYFWSRSGLVLPDGYRAPGSVMGIYAQAYVNYATGISTPTPLRAINNKFVSGSIVFTKNEADVFWPHMRLVDDTKTPDTNATPPAYLTKPMGTTVADTYYDKFQVGSGTGAYREIPDTLAQFNSRYLASRAVSATYYNVGDLGIGRKMTCAQPSWNAAGATVYGTACAVSNYAPASASGSKAPIAFGQAQAAINLMKNNAPPFATVVMVKRSGTAGSMFGVYIPSTTPPTTDPAKTKLVKTNVFLDSTGANTAAPNNCMACHGGSAGNNPLDLSRPSMFLPFDPQAIADKKVSADLDTKGWDWAHQEEAFRKLNQMVVNAGASDGIKDFVNGSYHGAVGTANTKLDPNYIPPGWQKSAAQKDVFTKVIKPYCRGCHMSQSGALAFTNASDIEGLRATVLSDVCKTHTMPHSQVTTKATWTTGARATLLSYFGRDDLDATTMSLEACKP
jgi:hypothetical protein